MTTTPRFHNLVRRDATEPLKVPVREKNVLDADPENPDSCVLALAAKSYRGIKWARVGSRITYIVFANEPDVAYRYLTPQGLTREFDLASVDLKAVAKWINGKTVTFSPPNPTARLGYKKGESGTDKRGSGTQRSVHHANPVRHMTFTSDWV